MINLLNNVAYLLYGKKYTEDMDSQQNFEAVVNEKLKASSPRDFLQLDLSIEIAYPLKPVKIKTTNEVQKCKCAKC